MTVEANHPVDLRDFKAALIVKPSSLGDIVHALPAVRLIKRAHPHLRLRWIANSEWTPLLEGCPFIDEVIPFQRKEFRGVAGGLKSLAWAARWNRTRRETPEIVLDFQGLLRSALISYSRGSDWIVGLADSREGASHFCDQIVPVDATAHAVDRYLEIPKAFGIPFSADDIQFPLPEGTKPAALEAHPPFVLIHPYSRGRGKTLAPASLQTLCDCLTGTRVIIVGVSKAPASLRGKHITDLTNQTNLSQLIWLMRHAKACVSVDSGPMHIAAAVNPRTLGIHTWSDPRRVGPYHPQAYVWKAGRISHRHELTAEECQTDQQVSEPDSRRLADFILGTLLA
jgi:ADP-heptose:LPS heptosyltransferase